MSGHSKWHRIKHKKALTDSKRSRHFSQLSRDIRTAAKAGTDPNKNASLREAIERAKKANLPQANIDRILKKQNTGTTAVLYEGFGPGGVAILVSAETDNTNRTVAELRQLFKQHSGSLGEQGSVKWKFINQAEITAAVPESVDADELELALIDAGADDIEHTDSEEIVVTGPVTAQADIQEALKKQGATVQRVDIGYGVTPDAAVELAEDAAQRLTELRSALEEHEDVIDVYTDAKS